MSSEARLGSQWEDTALVEAWAGAVEPFGDLWRRVLVNPVILHLSTQGLSAYEGLNAVRKMAHEFSDALALTEWYRSHEPDVRDLRVLDLGCGEGWLGRWLTPHGAKYLGLDGSDSLISKATAAAQGTPSEKIRFSQINLSGDSDLSMLDTTVEWLGQADLVTAIVVLEHLEDPVPSLRRLSKRFAGGGSSARFLAICLNPPFFERHGKKLNRSEAPRPSHACIDSIGHEVDCIFRCEREMLRLFRDSRLIVEYSAPLHFPPAYEQSILQASSMGLAPFHAFVARPERRGDAVSPSELDDLLTSNKFLSLIQGDEHQRDTMRRQIGLLERRSFPAGEEIVRAHNLGGDVFVVLSGEAVLDAPGGLPLRRGETFGELEACKVRPNYHLGESTYIYSVRAGEGGATVLRIAEPLATELLADASTSPASHLFWQLRDRITIRLWPTSIRTQSAKGAAKLALPKRLSKILKNQKSIEPLRNVAAVLVSAADAERLRPHPRSIDGCEVLIETSKLVTVSYSFPDYLKFSLTALAVHRVIDVFNGRLILGHPKWQREAWGDWRRATRVAANRFLGPFADALGGEAENILGIARGEDGKGEVAFTGRDSGFGFTNLVQTANAWTRDVRELRRVLHRAYNERSWKEAVDRHLTFCLRANGLWASADFVVIRDENMLRRLVVDDDGEVVRELEERQAWLECTGFKSVSSLTQDAFHSEQGRVYSYMARRAEFVETDLDGDGELRQSSGRVYIEPPAWPEEG